jgi:hypothetical protein
MSTRSLEQINAEVEYAFKECETLLDEAIPLAQILLFSMSNLQTEKLSENENGHYKNVNLYVKGFLERIQTLRNNARKSINDYVKSSNKASLDTMFYETNDLSNTLTVLGDTGVLNYIDIDVKDKDLKKRIEEGTATQEDYDKVLTLPGRDYFLMIMGKLGSLEAVTYRDELCNYLHDAHWKIEHIHMNLIPEIEKFWDVKSKA